MNFSLDLCIICAISLLSYCSAVPSRGAIRLIRNNQYSPTQSWSSGIVQIYYSNTWGNICDDTYFDADEADVICHQLSYTGASSYSYTAVTTSFGTDNSTTLIEDVSCSSSDYLVLLQCSVSSQYSSYCSGDSRDVVVTCFSSRIWENPYPGQIRLTGGNYSNEGLLEIYCNGQWGTVCDDGFDSIDAYVACNQLGYNSYSNYDHLNIVGNSSEQIWLRNIYCSSSSLQCLDSCQSCPSIGTSFCTHSEDITLDCSYSSSRSSSTVTERTCATDTVGPSSVGAMRLLNGGSTSLYNTAGRVQVWYGGEWGNICYDSSFDSYEADVICHQLGWNGASSYSRAQYDSFATDYLPTVIDELSCYLDTYLTIFQCSYSTSISSSCDDDQDVSVTCYTTRIWNSPYTGQIRLVRGQYSNQGLLEVYCNGQWGTVCDDLFGYSEARVVCRQLGYSGYYSYDSLSITGNISQPIWLDDVNCVSSSYSCLAYCATCPSAQYDNCGHSEDITVECTISSVSSVSTTTSTCVYADSGPTDTSISTINVGGLVGGIIGGTFFIIIVSFAIPICVCCCIGVGVGSATRSPRTRVVATTPGIASTAAVVTTTQQQQQQQEKYTPQYVANPPPAYPAQGYSPEAQTAEKPYQPPSYNDCVQDQQHPIYPPSGPELTTPYGMYTTTPQQVPAPYSSGYPPPSSGTPGQQPVAGGNLEYQGQNLPYNPPYPPTY